MPRKARIDYPGALHHVIIRGINRGAIFRDDQDRKEFIRRLQKGLEKTKIACYAWALIPNHCHLLLRTGPQPLTVLMRGFLTGYALFFNKRHQRVGYLFQNRYKSILCDEEAYLLQLVRYIHLNPLRAGLVSTLHELNNFPWSGHSVLLGRQRAEWQDSSEILSRFGSIRKKAQKDYLEFVWKGVNEGRRFDLTGGGLIRSIGGWQNVRELRKSGERWRGDERMLGDGDFVCRALHEAEEDLTKKEKKRSAGWDLERLLNHVAKLRGIEKSLILGKKKSRVYSQARALFTWWATEELGFTITEVANFLDKSLSTIFKSAEKGNEIEKQEKLSLLKK